MLRRVRVMIQRYIKSWSWFSCDHSDKFLGRHPNLDCEMKKSSCVLLGRLAASSGRQMAFVSFFFLFLLLRMKMSQRRRKRMWWQVISERGSFVRSYAPHNTFRLKSSSSKNGCAFVQNHAEMATLSCKKNKTHTQSHTCTNTEQFHQQQQHGVKAGAGSWVCCEGVHSRYSCGCCRSGIKGGAEFWCGIAEFLHHEILHCGFIGRV